VRFGFFLIVSIMLSRIKIITSKLSMNVEQLRQEMAERRQAQQALNKQRDKFLSVLIHDLKGPLIPVLGFTKRILEGKSKSEEELANNHNTIYQSSSKLMKIIENTSKDLREKSVLQSINPEEVDLSKMMISVVRSSMPELENRGINILINDKSSKEWDSLERVILHSDPAQIRTLFENLVGNAIKYADNTINIRLHKNGSRIRFVISDDGPGIPEKYHKNIFEEYFQIPGSKKETALACIVLKKAKGMTDSSAVSIKSESNTNAF